MKIDKIKEVRIDELGRLCIKPETQTFTQIFTLAVEVHWDNEDHFLYSPTPREWSYYDWFKHIIKTVKKCNCDLILTDNTHWVNIPDSLKNQIIERI